MGVCVCVCVCLWVHGRKDTKHVCPGDEHVVQKVFKRWINAYKKKFQRKSIWIMYLHVYWNPKRKNFDYNTKKQFKTAERRVPIEEQK